MDYSSVFQNAPETADPGQAAAPAGPTGMSAMDAIPESPLGLMQQAMLGWARQPDEQLKYLKSQFKDAALVPNNEGGAQLAAQDKDGKWYQVDPAMHWSSSSTGGSVPDWDNHNAKTLAGRFMRETGEYGLRVSAAMAAGTAGMEAGAAAGSVAGPIGALVGGAAGGLASAGLAAAGAEGVDMGARKIFNPAGAAGAPPVDPAQIHSQLLGSALFGMHSFAEGKLFEAGVGGAAKVLGKSLETMVGTEGGKEVARKILTGMGANEGLVEARLMNPTRTAAYDQMAATDARSVIKSTGMLDKAEDAAFTDIHKGMLGALKREQGEFAALEQMPGVKNLRTDNAPVLQQSVDGLKLDGILKADGRINLERPLGDGDKEALNFISRLQKKGGDMGYKDIRSAVEDIGTLFNKGIQSNRVRLALVDLKKSLNESIINGLDDSTGAAYGSLLEKYGAVRGLMEDLGSVTEGQKKYSLVGKLVNTEKRTVARDLLGGMEKAGMDMDSVHKLLQIQSARESRSWFTGPKLLGVRVPFNGNAAGRAIGGMYSSIDQAAAGVGKMVPYTDQAVRLMRKLPPEQLRQVLTQPEIFDQISGTVAASAGAEKQATDQLMQGVNGQ
jgi:hypothetical protein